MRWFVVMLLLLGSLSPVWAAPQIAVENLNYNFGKILQGDQVEYVFRFRNTGDQVLQVGNVRSSCGCTAALLSATRIAPGDMGELRTTFDSTRFKGGIHKTVTIDTNDPQQSQVSFALSGDVKAELLIEPERVNWGKVKKDASLTATVKITNQGSKTVTLKNPKATNPAVRGELSALQLEPGAQVELQISAQLPEQKNRISGYVIVNTDYSKVPQIRVSVAARLAK